MARKKPSRPVISCAEMASGTKNRHRDSKTSNAASAERAPSLATDSTANRTPGPVVGIGASAGGLEAFTRLLQRLPADTGMAFVLVQHLSPHHPSMLAALLSHATTMPVMAVEHGTAVAANHVYVIPPGSLMSIGDGVLQLAPRSEERGPPRIIDNFLRSLAVDRRALAIGVVLSGADADGALGMQAIRAAGGIAIVQSESSARHAEMPRAAMSAGPVDFVLAPEQIASELRRLAHDLYSWGGPLDSEAELGRQATRVSRIFVLLHSATKVDFSGYRFEIVWPRIRRRMLLHGCDLDAYIALLEGSPSEVLALYDDILLRASEFFSDPAAFDNLQKDILPTLLRNRTPDLPLRVWVPGCSTGEEVYSIAMCLVEATAKLGIPAPIQLFGTDLNERAIAIARGGTYAEYAVARIGNERLQQFFRRVAEGYQVVKPLRELCVFARQNFAADPPFGRLDVISCRDLLAYFGPEWQRNAFIRLHYALRPGGYVMPGDAEALRGHSGLFTPVSSAPSFFARAETKTPLPMLRLGRGLDREPQETASIAPSSGAARALDAELASAFESLMLPECTPAWMLLNDSLEIIHSRGDVTPYVTLRQDGGKVKLLDAATAGVRSELENLLTLARDKGSALESARSEMDLPYGRVRLHVRRTSMREAGQPGFVVLFVRTDAHATAPAKPPTASTPASPEGERLRQRLALTGERLQAIIHLRDEANRELRSANDKIQSSNDNLRAINEELEVTKEELQAANEELSTVNDELQNRNEELTRLSDDLGSLLTSTTIPLVMVDTELRIRRVTTAAQHVFNLQPGDVGRLFRQIRTRLAVQDLDSRLRSIIQSLQPQQVEVQDDEGRSYSLRMYPCHAADGRVQGAVLVLVDVDQVRRAEMAATAARQFAESVVKNLKVPLLVLHRDLRVHSANEAFCALSRIKSADIVNQPLYEWNKGEWDLPSLRAGLQYLAKEGTPIENLEIEHTFKEAGAKTLLVNAHSARRDGELQILMAMEDVTERRRVEHRMAEDREQLRRSVHESEAALLQNRGELRALTARLLNTEEDERRRISRELHDDLSQKLAKLQFDVETLKGKFSPDQGNLIRGVLDIRDEVITLAESIREIAHRLHPSMLENLGLPAALKCLSREFGEAARLQIRFRAQNVPKRLAPEVAISLYRVAQEALLNISRHAGNTAVIMQLAGAPKRLRLSIQDTGAGFDPQAVRGKGGLGLISMQERVRLLHGKFSLQAREGHGVQIMIEVPLEWEGSANATAAAAR